MNTQENTIDTVFFAVVTKGKANALLHKAQELGARGGTIFLAEGTTRSRFLNKVNPAHAHKELVMIGAGQSLCASLHEMVFQTFKFYKRRKGIAFSIPFKHWESAAENPSSNQEPGDGYSAIITIVNRGRGVECVQAARKAGARGGTIIHGHGAGIPKEYFFPLSIEPQKDMVIILSKKETLQSIKDSILVSMNLAEPGNGILFILPVLRTSGLFENRMVEQRGAGS